MRTQLKRILEKDSWSGRELGILQIARTAIMTNGTKQGKPEEQIIDLGTLADMVGTLTSQKDIQDYNGYCSIYEWLITFHYASAFRRTRARSVANAIMNRLEKAMLAEIITERGKEFESPEFAKYRDSLTAETRFASRFSLEQVAKTAEKNTAMETVTLQLDLYYIVAYNTILKLIAKEFSVPEIVPAFTKDISDIGEAIDYIEGMRGKFANILSLSYTGTDKQRARRISLLPGAFPTIAYKDIAMPQEAVDQASKMLKGGFSAFWRISGIDRFFKPQEQQ